MPVILLFTLGRTLKGGKPPKDNIAINNPDLTKLVQR